MRWYIMGTIYEEDSTEWELYMKGNLYAEIVLLYMKGTVQSGSAPKILKSDTFYGYLQNIGNFLKLMI